jgi:cysteine-rich repeat protein
MLYAKQKTRSHDRIEGSKGKCAGDPVLGNYLGGDPVAAVYPLIDNAIEGNSNLTEGTQDTPCDTAESKCRETVARSRSQIFNEVVRDSAKCQKTVDSFSTTFGAINPSCVSTSDAASVAFRRIEKDCAGIPGNTIGVCEPLPDCAISGAIASAQGVAKAIYSVTPAAVCGNGTLEAGEQCDDGNLTDGDGCSHLCEIEGKTCTPVLSGPGSTSNTKRIETVGINTPTPLGGIVIHLGYPVFDAGIPGTGGSSLVQSRLTPLQTVGLGEMNDTDNNQLDVGLVELGTGLMTGQLFKVTYDNCVAMNQNICSRNPNVFGCCNDATDPNQFQIPTGSEICSIKGCATFKPSCTTDAQCGNIAGDCSVSPTCTTDANCGNIAGDCVSGTCATFKTCATFEPTCTSDAQCGGVAGDCQGVLCAANTDVCIGAGSDNSPEFGTCVFKCPAHPPVCANGHFPLFGAGTCDNKNGSCPSNNSCQTQVGQFACSVDNPVDLQGSPVNGVTCTVSVVEAP